MRNDEEITRKVRLHGAIRNARCALCGRSEHPARLTPTATGALACYSHSKPLVHRFPTVAPPA
jgi:hypothetical protein